MFFENESAYPTPDVRRLVDLAAVPYDLSKCIVVVRNFARRYRGLAYPGLGKKWRHYPPGFRYAVEVFIGAPSEFHTPVSNLRTRYRWVRITDAERDDLPRGIPTRSCSRAGETWMEKSVATTAPYGGKKSPLIWFHDWQEAIVGVAAHEFHHISQFQQRIVAREWPAERAAEAALERYRAQKSPESATAPGQTDYTTYQTILS